MLNAAFPTQQNASSFPLQRRKAFWVSQQLRANSQKLLLTARAETEDDRLKKDRLEVLAKNA